MLGFKRTFLFLRTRRAAALSVFVFCVFAILFSLEPALAQTPFEQFAGASILPQTSLLLIIARLIRTFLGILGIVFVILIIYAGYLYMVSKGDPAKTKKAKELIKNAVIGFAIIMSSYGIASFVINAILGGGGGQITAPTPIFKYTEPLAGSLGAGIIETHYPPRNAIDIPRNTKIFITFKEAIDPASIIKDYNKDLSAFDANQAKGLKIESISIFETAKGESQKLASTDVQVTAIEDEVGAGFTTFVFKPVEYLGDPVKDTNYTVALHSGIQKADGKNAFVGAYASGYGWTFEVSTVIDLTPPQVVSVIPKNASTKDMNTIVEITFNEAMDPIATTGVYKTGAANNFTNITVNTADAVVAGKYKLSNGYRTVSFVTDLACAEDPCGNTIYCLPPNQDISVEAHAASVDPLNPPQALISSTLYDGVTDASGNSLDGNGDGLACSTLTSAACTSAGSNDDYTWGFKTTGVINNKVPQIASLAPEIDGSNIDQNVPIQVVFDTELLASSVVSSHASLWPDPYYSMWFVPGKDDVGEKTTISIKHPAFISNADGGYDYYPVLTEGLRSAYQICMYPAKDGEDCKNTNSTTPFCCDGQPSGTACVTSKGNGVLPGNLCGTQKDPQKPYCCSGTLQKDPCAPGG